MFWPTSPSGPTNLLLVCGRQFIQSFPRVGDALSLQLLEPVAEPLDSDCRLRAGGEALDSGVERAEVGIGVKAAGGPHGSDLVLVEV